MQFTLDMEVEHKENLSEEEMKVCLNEETFRKIVNHRSVTNLKPGTIEHLYGCMLLVPIEQNAAFPDVLTFQDLTDKTYLGFERMKKSKKRKV